MMDINQTNDNTRITTEENIFLTDKLLNIQVSRTSELIAGIIVSSIKKKTLFYKSIFLFLLS